MTDLTGPVALTTQQMATFAARGFLKFDGVIPDEINQQFLKDVGSPSDLPDSLRGHYEKIRQSSTVPVVRAGTPLCEAYPADSALARLVSNPIVAGAIESLVGLDCTFDHHFLHMTFPEDRYPEAMRPIRSQDTHQDSTIDPRQAFDIQIFYFPHEVSAEMGGTRFVPGTHFRVVSEAAVSRYQNIVGQEHVVCPAGTVLIFHMGLWHGAGKNQSDLVRYLFKIRLAPTRRQRLLWDPEMTVDPLQRAIFWTDGSPTNRGDLHTILTRAEKWFEADTGRLEYLNRIRFWRYLTGDDNFDADYWMTRIENEYT